MKKVQNTHNGQFDALHNSLLTLVGAFNRPQRDLAMIRGAGIELDRALFPLLVQVGRFGPIGVGELADRVGRDYTTVSRQVAKLEETGLVRRQKNGSDKRINEAAITPAGTAMTDRIDAQRVQIYQRVFAHWPEEDRAALEQLLQRFVNDFSALRGDEREEA
ncbi:MarR family transcriptional regulator [Pantoea conspicua]|uniref:MarR family transcriptional regulator n=1 Tax=Pantoea conspicua TaxID=472705 RepID=A0A1X1BYT3_9GAMM|nr:MarR family winged helix-turn-helix transcriptional regulator [Pantoea conspicua]ORM54165.1 MarR family transcriptional regulator [Pantoea conspicua]